jgi:hypothetical protein
MSVMKIVIIKWNFADKKNALEGNMYTFISVFLYISMKKNNLSVTSAVSLNSQHLLDPLGHGVAQVSEVLLGEASHPEHLDLPGQLGDGSSVHSLEFFLHIIPAVFNGVEIRAVARPVHDLKGFVRQVCLDALAGVARRPILEEVGGAVVSHELEQVVL